MLNRTTRVVSYTQI